MADRKSVILVTVDCLRADHCSFMGYAQPTTPFLKGLAKESFVFPNAVVAGVPTYYSFPAILASRSPLAIGREVLGLASGETNLASTLKDTGYRTAFFGAANPYLSAQFGYDFGFETFSNSPQSNPNLPDSRTARERDNRWSGIVNQALAKISHGVPGLANIYDELYFQYCQRRSFTKSESLDQLRRFPAADVIVRDAEAWLSSVGENRFFLWLHFMDPHAPYYPTEEALNRMGQTALTAARAKYLNAYWNRSDLATQRLRRHRNEIIDMYDAGIRWVDEQISRLVTFLQTSKVWDNCVFALTSDHGEQFLDHDARFHSPALTEELIRVPLLLRIPGSRKREIGSRPFSLLHLAPTLLGAAGVPVPTDFQGENLWPEIQAGRSPSLPAVAECVIGCTNPLRPDQRLGGRMLAIRDDKHKLVLSFDEVGRVRLENLYDLEVDPEELRPLPPGSYKSERAYLLRHAFQHLQTRHPGRESNSYLRTRMVEIRQALNNTAFTVEINCPDHERETPVQ